MFFKKEKKLNKLDKLITTVIIGGAIGSVFGIYRKLKGEKVKKSGKKEGIIKKTYVFLGNSVIKFLDLFSKKGK